MKFECDMKQAVALLLACVGAACANAPAASAQAGTRAGAVCDAQATAEWPGSRGAVYSATATASGRTCAQAVVLLVVRDAAGDVLWADALVAAHVAGLHEATTPAAMSRALEEWSAFPARHPQTTSDLPDWGRVSGQQGEAEFPFMPEPWLGEDLYQDLLVQAKPMFCYAQGRESLVCLTELFERLEKIGVQSFAG